MSGNSDVDFGKLNCEIGRLRGRVLLDNEREFLNTQIRRMGDTRYRRHTGIVENTSLLKL